MKKKLLSIALSSLVVVSLFIGCSNKKNNENTTVPTNMVSVEHAMGTTEIPTNPQKVVILTSEGTEALLALGVKPVGAVTGVTGDWYDHTKDELEGVKQVGMEREPNIEAIAALKPDLIIGNKMRHEKIYSQLSSIAPTVYSDTIRGAWKDNFKFYAKVLNKESESEKALKEYDDKIAYIQNNYKDKLDTEISLIRFMSGKTRIYLGNTFAGTILKEIGFNTIEGYSNAYEISTTPQLLLSAIKIYNLEDDVKKIRDDLKRMCNNNFIRDIEKTRKKLEDKVNDLIFGYMDKPNTSYLDEYIESIKILTERIF